MPHWKCKICHHEWDGFSKWCDWCHKRGWDIKGEILEDKSPFEKFIKDLRKDLRKDLEDLLEEIDKDLEGILEEIDIDNRYQ